VNETLLGTTAFLIAVTAAIDKQAARFEERFPMPNLECGVEASAGLQLPWPPAIKPRQRKLLHVRLFPLSVHQPTDRLRRRDVHLDEQLKQPDTVGPPT
jgi:hypothetical protein